MGNQPRGQEGITFEQLRSLANTHDITRLAIETRKDQVEKVPFAARLIPKRGEAKGQLKARAQADGRLEEINDFLKHPGRVLYYPESGEQPQLKLSPWNGWLRALLEDLFVIDAPTVMVRRTLDPKTPFSLDVMDGALWKPLVDRNGNVTSYQQWLYGVPGETLGPNELVYMPRNPRSSRAYGLSVVESIVVTINIMLRRMAKQLAHYTIGNIPEAMCRTPEGWSPAMVEQFQKNFDTYLEGNAAARSKLLFMPGGTSPVQLLGQESLTTTEDEYWIRVVMYAFSLSPQWAVKMMNRATAESAQEEALEQGLMPALQWIAPYPEKYGQVVFTPDGQRVVVTGGSTPGTLRVWDARKGPAGQKQLTDGGGVKKRHYDPANPHVILDRLAQLEKKAAGPSA